MRKHVTQTSLNRGVFCMNTMGLKIPKFLNLDETAQKKIIEDVSNNSDIPEHDKQATIESMVFLKEFQMKLKKNPNITMKQIKQLFAAHAEKLKKLLLIP